MGNTIVFNVSSNAQPAMTVNHMKYAIYRQTDLSTIIASHSFAPLHPQRTVSFPGLTRDNYRFRLLETLPDDTTIVREMDYFDFVPGNNDILYFPPEEIQADFTTGVVSGATSFTFNGTAGTEDWRGREIYVERVGQGTMKRGVQYSWDSTSGIFTLLQLGDAFQPGEYFNVEFGLIVDNTSSVPQQTIFTGTLVVTGTTTLVAGDMGKKIIIKGASSAFDITLPDLTGMSDSVLTYFESGIGNHKCVRIKTASGQIIDWLKGSRTDIKMGVCESVSLYKELGSPAPGRWRVHEWNGNFLSVGRIISSDALINAATPLSGQEFNVIEMDGSALSISDYARLYEDFVLQLPGSEVVAFASWSTGTNKYKWSLSNGGLFHCPDRRNLYQRNSDGTIVPGSFQDYMLLDHEHEETIGTLPIALFGQGTVRLHGTYDGTTTTKTDLTGPPVTALGVALTANLGAEVRPITYITRHFVLT